MRAFYFLHCILHEYTVFCKKKIKKKLETNVQSNLITLLYTALKCTLNHGCVPFQPINYNNFVEYYIIEIVSWHYSYCTWKLEKRAEKGISAHSVIHGNNISLLIRSESERCRYFLDRLKLPWMLDHIFVDLHA